MESIREATLDDIEQIYRLIEALEETNIDSMRFSEVFQANILNPSVYYYIYEREDVVLGFISIHIQKLLHHSSNIAEIQEFIIDETIRYQEIGKHLFQKAKEIARDNGCQQLEVCCNQKRISSHQFYQSQGMTNNHYKFCLPL